MKLVHIFKLGTLSTLLLAGSSGRLEQEHTFLIRAFALVQGCRNGSYLLNFFSSFWLTYRVGHSGFTRSMLRLRPTKTNSTWLINGNASHSYCGLQQSNIFYAVAVYSPTKPFTIITLYNSLVIYAL